MTPVNLRSDRNDSTANVIEVDILVATAHARKHTLQFDVSSVSGLYGGNHPIRSD